MKNIITSIAALFIITLSSFAQDMVTLRNGTMLQGSILEVNAEVLKMKRSDNPDGPVYTIMKSDIYKVEYQNGSKEVWNDKGDIDPDYVPTPQDRTKYNGPRVGFTYIGDGYIADAMIRDGKTPFVTQFGYQFETRLFHIPNGLSGRMEFVPMLGGLEQGMFLPSASLLVGLRGGKGYEIGMGPNLSRTGMGMIFAIGTSFRSGGVNFPIHLAVLPSIGKRVYGSTYDPATNTYVPQNQIIHSGVRISLLVGFNTRKN